MLIIDIIFINDLKQSEVVDFLREFEENLGDLGAIFGRRSPRMGGWVGGGGGAGGRRLVVSEERRGRNPKRKCIRGRGEGGLHEQRLGLGGTLHITGVTQVHEVPFFALFCPLPLSTWKSAPVHDIF